MMWGSDSSTDDWYVTATGFDELGRTIQRTLARNTAYTTYAALVRHYGYDTETGALDTIQAGWDTTPADLSGNTWFQYDRYTRDAVGNVTVIEDRGLEVGGANSATKECFVYDVWNRLVRAHTAPGTGDGAETVGCATDTGTGIDDSARGNVDTYDRTWSFDDINRLDDSVDLTASSNTTTTWGYGSTTKHAVQSLTGQTTGTYTYNTVGAMVTRNSDTLTYDPQQRLIGYDTSSVDDAYWYTTSNQRLIRQHGSTVTLYLGDMEIGYDGTNTTVTRHISIAGTQVATRTTTNGGTATIAWNCANMQNSTICQAPAATNATPPIPGRKRYTPYGDDRNTAPTWATDHGFLNQPEDTTGLTYLNNRYSDPQLAAFITVDPLVGKTGTPYLYANGTPATLSDPSGLEPGCGVTQVSASSCSDEYSLQQRIRPDYLEGDGRQGPLVEEIQNEMNRCINVWEECKRVLVWGDPDGGQWDQTATAYAIMFLGIMIDDGYLIPDGTGGLVANPHMDNGNNSFDYMLYGDTPADMTLVVFTYHTGWREALTPILMGVALLADIVAVVGATTCAFTLLAGRGVASVATGISAVTNAAIAGLNCPNEADLTCGAAVAGTIFGAVSLGAGVGAGSLLKAGVASPELFAAVSVYGGIGTSFFNVVSLQLPTGDGAEMGSLNIYRYIEEQ